MLRLEKATKVYQSSTGRVRAADQIDLTVGPGEFVAIQGASGSGKSTVLLMAGGMLAPDSGQVLLADDSLYNLTPNQRAKLRAQKVGFVFQQFHLIPYLSVEENIKAPAITSDRPVVDTNERCRELLAEFRLDHRSQHTPAELSSGECQRVAMARAVFNHPVLLLADEPTGNLDSVNSEIILTHLTAFAEAGGSVLLVTHETQAASTANRAVTLADGQVVD